MAGADEVAAVASADRHIELALLHDRDPDTVVHSVHVATIAVDLARALGVEDERLADLRLAAKLHDIGKIAVKDEILNKRGSLDEEEFRIVKTHPVVGAELLRAWGLEGPALFVLEHHEHVDGSGYPSGLRGEEIALESRIIHVADAYVAMTLDRPYRRAMQPRGGARGARAPQRHPVRRGRGRRDALARPLAARRGRGLAPHAVQQRREPEPDRLLARAFAPGDAAQAEEHRRAEDREHPVDR